MQAAGDGAEHERLQLAVIPAGDWARNRKGNKGGWAIDSHLAGLPRPLLRSASVLLLDTTSLRQVDKKKNGDRSNGLDVAAKDVNFLLPPPCVLVTKQGVGDEKHLTERRDRLK
jgi:hypothetical protein